MEREVSQAVYQYLLSLVPYGKLTHYEAISNYVAKLYGEKILSCNGLMRFHSPAEWDILLKYVPRHREVSSSGMLLHTYQAEKLREEGHTIVPYSRRNDSPKVENARNFWFDFDKEANVDPNILYDIDRKMSCVEYLLKDGQELI